MKPTPLDPSLEPVQHLSPGLQRKLIKRVNKQQHHYRSSGGAMPHVHLEKENEDIGATKYYEDHQSDGRDKMIDAYRSIRRIQEVGTMDHIQFLKEMQSFESQFAQNNYRGTFTGSYVQIRRFGTLPVLLVAPLAVKPVYEDREGREERYTGSFALTLAKYAGATAFVPLRSFFNPTDPSPVNPLFQAICQEVQKSTVHIFIEIHVDYTPGSQVHSTFLPALSSASYLTITDYTHNGFRGWPHLFSMLDESLHTHSIRYDRVDGGTSQQQREWTQHIPAIDLRVNIDRAPQKDCCELVFALAEALQQIGSYCSVIHKERKEWGLTRNVGLKPLTRAEVKSGRKLLLEEEILHDIDLSGRKLPGAYFQGSDLRRANLSKTKLKRAMFNASDLTDANMRGAVLTGAKFKDAILTGCDFTGAVLSEKEKEKLAGRGAIGLDQTILPVLRDKQEKKLLQGNGKMPIDGQNVEEILDGLYQQYVGDDE